MIIVAAEASFGEGSLQE
jgi:hypothetical protein